MSGLSVLLLNHCFDLDARASAAPPRGTQSGKPVARDVCLPRLAREKRPTWRSNGPPAAWVYFTQIHESTYENHRSVIGEPAPLSIIPRAADASRTSRPVQEYCED
jgi:hypothetical protein